jgi:hypothetical protein
MIETLEAPDHVVAFRASGRIDEADIERSFAAVEAALARHEQIGLYAEVDVTGITPGALARDLRYSLGKLRELQRFPRVAVVTSQDWLRWAARVEGAILPQIEVRVFPPAEREDALAWVMQPPAPVPTESPSAPRSVHRPDRR